jgi:hypothetical protein
MATTKATLLGHRSATSFSDLTLSGDLTVNGTTTTLDTAVQNVDKLEIGASSTDYGAKINQTSTGNILQLQDNGTDVMVVEDGGNVGIGGSPGARLHVETSGNTGIQIRSGTTTSNGFINFNDGATAKGQIFYDHDGDYMRLYVNGAERLRIDSSGDVGIGRSPNGKLDAYIGSGLGGINVGAGGASATYLDSDNIYLRSGGGTQRMQIDSSGALMYSAGNYAASKRVTDLTLTGGADVLFNLWSGAEGRGHYLVSVTRNSASVATRSLAIVASSSSSVSFVYTVLDSTAITIGVNGSNVTATGTANQVVHAVAIPLAIEGN